MEKYSYNPNEVNVMMWRWNEGNMEVMWRYWWIMEWEYGLFWGPTYPQTEGIACPHAINYITFWYLSFGLNSAWYHLLNFCKVFLMNCNLVGSCVSTIFCLLHSILMYDLCIMYFFYCRVFLLECIMVGSCVTTMIVLASN